MEQDETKIGQLDTRRKIFHFAESMMNFHTNHPVHLSMKNYK